MMNGNWSLSKGAFCHWFKGLLRGAQVWRISKSLGWVPASATRDQAYEHLNQRVPDDVKCVASGPLHHNHPGICAQPCMILLGRRGLSTSWHHDGALFYTTNIFKLGERDEPMTLAQV